MKVHFGQIYMQPGVTFPFSTRFQRSLGDEITQLVQPSATFIRKYGTDWELMFRISAKTQIDDSEIRGPTLFKKDKDIEYTVFLPFDTIAQSGQVPQSALQFLLKACCHVFRTLNIDPTIVEQSKESMISRICSDREMFA